MTPKDIKAAAEKLADLERIEQIIADIRSGAKFTIGCGHNLVFLDKSSSAPILTAVENYLTSSAKLLKQGLVEQEVDGIEDPFEAALAELEADARPQ